jgi:hypothetical protein
MDQMELSEEGTEDQMETIGFVLGMLVRDWSAEVSIVLNELCFEFIQH